MLGHLALSVLQARHLCSVTALCCSHGTVIFELVLVNARSFSHLTICTIRVGDRQRPLLIAVFLFGGARA